MKIYIATFLLFLTAVSCLPDARGVTPGIPGYTQLKSDELRYLQNHGFGATRKTFRPTVAYEEVEYKDSNPESTQGQATYAVPNYPVPVKTTPLKAFATATPKYFASPNSNDFRRPAGPNKLEEEEEEDDKEEEQPDRLTELLPQSKFQCNGKKTGYYADQDLGCEIFHYCHENAKHSWICPEGFTFHQIQLICMPPGGDNICEKSSDYHFVNDYLYKPVNLQEYQQKPNISLKYSDRYFPEAYRPKFDDDDAPVQHQHSVRVANVQRYQPVQSSTFKPQAALGQVFRSPEEINISLQQRRPQFNTPKYDSYRNYLSRNGRCDLDVALRVSCCFTIIAVSVHVTPIFGRRFLGIGLGGARSPSEERMDSIARTVLFVSYFLMACSALEVST
ncbi:hypothetical protein GWI33_006500 [Rhynchophorus ferrugineus]|uniref:Chitin-binding type-2 domain-containing protein n=1 Tax=Rhynchophorus ferrugineus TaxID=354439 RepID=A0A834IFY3_RHYFE|nr:hypothetical protein GWI33_006500 [Rhynchophorus ferrugineus]